MTQLNQIVILHLHIMPHKHAMQNTTDANNLLSCLKQIYQLLKMKPIDMKIVQLSEMTLENISDYETETHIHFNQINVMQIENILNLNGVVMIELESGEIGVYSKKNYKFKSKKFVAQRAWHCLPICSALPTSLTSSIKMVALSDIKHFSCITALTVANACFMAIVSISLAFIFSHLIEYKLPALTLHLVLIFGLVVIYFIFYNLYQNKIYQTILSFISCYTPPLWQYFLEMPLTQIQQSHSGDLVNRLQLYEQGLYHTVKALFSIIYLCVSLVFITLVISYLNLYFSCILIMLIICLILFNHLIIKKKLSGIAQLQLYQGKLKSFLIESLMQITKIRSANAGVIIHTRWLKLLRLAKSYEKQIMIFFVHASIGEALFILSVSLLYLTYLTHTDTTTANLFLLLLCLMQAITIVKNIMSEMQVLTQFLPSLMKANTFLQTTIEDRPVVFKFENTMSSIGMNDVSLKLTNSEIVLNNVYLKVSRGEFIGIVGESGSGKSLLLKLIMGLINPTKGQILYNETCYSQINLQRLRQTFAVILQHAALLPGTIYSNITANQPLSLDEAWQLAERVGLAEDISKMPMKMFTHVSDNASESLSGGQRQKLLLARALALKRQVLILDEATSALDSLSQQKVMQYISDLPLTKIMVAHRESTLKGADKIYKLENGILMCQ